MTERYATPEFRKGVQGEAAMMPIGTKQSSGNPLANATLPARPSYRQDPDFIWEKVDLELAIRSIKEDLLYFAGLLASQVERHPPSAILIEDTSARFIGRFLVKALNLEDRPECPIFYVRPPGPLDFSAPKLASFNSEFTAHLPALGDAPLVITEYIAAGNHAGHLTSLLATHSVFCTYSSLYLLDRTGGDDYRNLQKKLSGLGARGLLAGLLVNHPELVSAVYQNQALNTVIAKGPYFLAEEAAAGVGHPYLFDWRTKSATPDELRTRTILKAHTEQRLVELVREFRESGGKS